MNASPTVATIFVVDGDHDDRDSVAARLRRLSLNVVAFDCAEDFQNNYQDDCPGCLILDVRLPGRSGLDFLAKLRAQGNQIPVIVMAVQSDVATAVAAMKAGAMEFLEKPVDDRLLFRLIQSALVMDAQRREADRRYHDLDQLVRQLSRTDRETLGLIVHGETNKAMADKLHITERAVELRRQRLMRKVGVRSLAELLELTITHRVLGEIRHAQLSPSSSSLIV